MLQALLFVEIISAIPLIFFILIQNKNVSLNLSTMSGGMAATSKRGAEKVLHNTTIVLGAIFIINSIALFLFS